MLHAKFIDSVTDTSYGWLLVPRQCAEQVNEAPDLVTKLTSAYRESVGLPMLEQPESNSNDISALASSNPSTMRMFGEVRPPTYDHSSNQASMVMEPVQPQTEVEEETVNDMMEEGTLHPPQIQTHGETEGHDLENQFRGMMSGVLVNTEPLCIVYMIPWTCLVYTMIL